MTTQNSTITLAQRRSSIEQIAQHHGIQPGQLKVEAAFDLGQVVAAQAVAVSESCGSGELPDRLQRRVEDREAELRSVVYQQTAQGWEREQPLGDRVS
ncbi:MAG: hypothetical protein EA417_14300 [Gammaproteobacteria bacterium]|nr:MAG: hypothetical protein EA417_14300 [Gammaproteobacteria bacterium]